jgi:hypothetical protein
VHAACTRALSCAQVWSPEQGRVHTEVAGTSPELNDLFSSALAARCLGGDESARLRAGLEKMVAFAEAVAEALAAAE